MLNSIIVGCNEKKKSFFFFNNDELIAKLETINCYSVFTIDKNTSILIVFKWFGEYFFPPKIFFRKNNIKLLFFWGKQSF